MAKPEIAVVIPAYNAAGFIRRALDSVFAQSLQPVEVTVVDDGSKDATALIVEEEYKGRARLVRQQNRGPAAARNVAIHGSNAEFVAFLDADDWWEPTKLERQAAVLMARPESPAVYTAMHMVSDTDGRVKLRSAFRAQRLPRVLRYSNPLITPSCLMARRSALVKVGGFSEEHAGCEDWAMWIDLIQLGPFVALDEPLTNYRVSLGGLSGNADHMYNDFLKMLDGRLLRKTEGVSREMWRRRAISSQAFAAAMTARASKDRSTEHRYLKLSLATWPSPFFEPKRFRAALVALIRSVKPAAVSVTSQQGKPRP